MVSSAREDVLEIRPRGQELTDSNGCISFSKAELIRIASQIVDSRLNAGSQNINENSKRLGRDLQSMQTASDVACMIRSTDEKEGHSVS